MKRGFPLSRHPWNNAWGNDSEWSNIPPALCFCFFTALFASFLPPRTGPPLAVLPVVSDAKCGPKRFSCKLQQVAARPVWQSNKNIPDRAELVGRFFCPYVQLQVPPKINTCRASWENNLWHSWHSVSPCDLDVKSQHFQIKCYGHSDRSHKGGGKKPL